MADDSIITYDKLYDLLRLEKYKKELQKLDSDFNTKLIRYLDEKTAILQSQENKESVFATQGIAKTKRQIENARTILKEIYEKREGKILQMVLFNSRTGEKLQETEALLEEEIKLYNDLVYILNLYREGILGNILQGKLPEIKKENYKESNELKNKTVRFIHAVPKFLGEDLNVYGPYEAEDIANLPQKVSLILLKNNRAEEI